MDKRWLAILCYYEIWKRSIISYNSWSLTYLLFLLLYLLEINEYSQKRFVFSFVCCVCAIVSKLLWKKILDKLEMEIKKVCMYSIWKKKQLNNSKCLWKVTKLCLRAVNNKTKDSESWNNFSKFLSNICFVLLKKSVLTMHRELTALNLTTIQIAFCICIQINSII